MLGNFMYCNPTKLYFGEDSLASLNEELPKYGQNVQLVYGGGSIKKNGIYDKVMDILKANGKNVLEDAGVMPNPTVQKLYEGCRIAREGKADLTLAAVSMAYYRFICPFGLAKFKRFAMNVWDVNSEGKSDEQVAAEGLLKMEAYMEELGLTMHLKELGVTEEMLQGIVESTLIMDGGYKVPDKDEIREILKNSL